MGYIAVSNETAQKKRREESKTNCDLFHCEVQGRGFCDSNVKKGATQGLTVNSIGN